jgi:hypothetical protein
MRHSLFHVNSTLRFNAAPLESDVRWVHARYGSGIGSYFAFFRFITVNAFFTFLILCANLAYQLSKQPSSWNIVGSFTPQWAVYSNFSLGLLYLGCLVLFFGFLILNAIFKWVKEDRTEMKDNVSDNSQTKTQYAGVVLNLWDFGVEGKDSSQDMRFSMESTLLSMMDEENVAEKVKNRTPEARFRLVLRRSFGLFINLCLIVSSWAAIIGNVMQARRLFLPGCFHLL